MRYIYFRVCSTEDEKIKDMIDKFERNGIPYTTDGDCIIVDGSFEGEKLDKLLTIVGDVENYILSPSDVGLEREFTTENTYLLKKLEDATRLLNKLEDSLKRRESLPKLTISERSRFSRLPPLTARTSPRSIGSPTLSRRLPPTSPRSPSTMSQLPSQSLYRPERRVI
jgi:hypothetical protein